MRVCLSRYLNDFFMHTREENLYDFKKFNFFQVCSVAVGACSSLYRAAFPNAFSVPVSVLPVSVLASASVSVLSVCMC